MSMPSLSLSVFLTPTHLAALVYVERLQPETFSYRLLCFQISQECTPSVPSTCLHPAEAPCQVPLPADGVHTREVVDFLQSSHPHDSLLGIEMRNQLKSRRHNPKDENKYCIIVRMELLIHPTEATVSCVGSWEIPSLVICLIFKTVRIILLGVVLKILSLCVCAATSTKIDGSEGLLR